MGFGEKTIFNVPKSLINKSGFPKKKMGGPGMIAQNDETMLNYSIKAHRGRAPTNRTDALCSVETRGGITRCFAEVIPDKRASTIVPIFRGTWPLTV